MEKINILRKGSDKFDYFRSAMIKLKTLKQTEIVNDLREMAGHEFCAAHEYLMSFNVIQDYCEKFFDCKDQGFSYILGCRYQKVDFDFPQNIDAEIKYLRALLVIYNPKFNLEISLINALINDLIKFKPEFEKYYNLASKLN